MIKHIYKKTPRKLQIHPYEANELLSCVSEEETELALNWADFIILVSISTSEEEKIKVSN